jgi:PAS domain S-box-containing protein
VGRTGATGDGMVRLPLPGGRMELFTTPYTPYFGREDMALLHNVAALLGVTLDRTHAHAREVAMREALDEAQRLAHLGSWRLDLATGAIDASDEMYRLYGLAPQAEPLTRECLREMVHPDDADAGRGQVTLAEQTGADFTNEYRIVLPDGTTRWIAARGRGLKDEEGNVVALLGTCQDVTEARRLDRMRSEFVANAAHELRTPLTTVSAMATLLATQRDRLGPVEVDNAFAALGRQGERARRLVTSLLDLSRIDAGRVPVQLVPTGLAGVVASALETAPAPAGAGVAVDVPESLSAMADADRLEEILVNLLSNAYRYGGPAVAVRARAEGGGVRVDVSEDGNGVPEDFLGELFQPFSRAATVTGTPGSGLGLAISQRLAVALGGDLAYRRDGGRTHFVLTLRAAP